MAAAGVVWLITWALPVTFMIAMAWACESHTRQLGRRVLLFYDGDADDAAAAIKAAKERSDEGHGRRRSIRIVPHRSFPSRYRSGSSAWPTTTGSGPASTGSGPWAPRRAVAGHRDRGDREPAVAMRLPAPPGLGLALRVGAEAGRAATRTAEAAFLMALDAALASPVAEQAVDRVLASPLADRTVDRVLASPLADRTVDRVLASPLADRTVDRVLASPLAERAVDRILAGPLMDAVAEDLVRHAVPQRLADQLLEAGIGDEIAARIVSGPELDRIVDTTLASPAFARLADSVVNSPAVERVADEVANSPGMERVVTRVIESRLVDAVVRQLLVSEDLWLLVSEIARSEPVTDAITADTLGFAGELAAEMRVVLARRRRPARAHRAAHAAAGEGMTALAHTRYVGLVTRAIAFAIDAAVIVGVAVLVFAVVALASAVCCTSRASSRRSCS